jgi:mannose-6-phosphate isomerase-like protein (cupin superfamily)
MRKISPAIASVLYMVLLIPVLAQAQEKTFTIENCVNQFTMDKAEKTSSGYLYWFVGKEFIDGRTIKLSVVSPDQASHAPHTHDQDEFFFVLEGKARFHLDGETVVAGPYTSLYCPANIPHGISNAGETDLKYLVIKKYPAPSALSLPDADHQSRTSMIR